MSDSKLEVYEDLSNNLLSKHKFVCVVREVVFKSISCDCLNCKIIRDNKTRVFVEKEKVEEK